MGKSRPSQCSLSGFSNVSQGGLDLPKFQLEIDAPEGEPEGERVELRKGPEYTPPSRDDVAKFVEEFETKFDKGEIKVGQGEFLTGVLLREAAEQLYDPEDASTKTTTNKSIFPHALLALVLTDTRVLSSLCLNSTQTKLGRYSADYCLEKICGDRTSDKLGEFARVFTVLLLCEVPLDIRHFFDNDIKDKDFPFEVKGRKLRSRAWDTVGGKQPKLEWTGMQYDSFWSYQWKVFLPYFSEELPHQIFEASVVMPWHVCPVHVPNDSIVTSGTATSTNEEAGTLSGGHSFVSRVIIHDGHYRFHGIPQVSTTESSLDYTII